MHSHPQKCIVKKGMRCIKQRRRKKLEIMRVLYYFRKFAKVPGFKRIPPPRQPLLPHKLRTQDSGLFQFLGLRLN
jgi:hypothetical protein